MPKSVHVRLDHKIHLRMNDLPDSLLEAITEALTIPNREKIEAERQKQWGWQNLPDEIELWSIEGQALVLPRGFARTLSDGLRDSGYEIVWTDARRWGLGVTYPERLIEPYEWQVPAMQEIASQHQGIYKAPAGSGKTATILFTIAALNAKALIIVNTKDILWQWQERARDFLGIEAGQVGDGVYEIGAHITIATAQTLHSRFEELEADGFFDHFDFVCLDECHHATANTYNRVVDRFSARYRVGVSATPDKTGDFILAQAVLGPVIHETHHTKVSSLMQPEVVRIPTNFTFRFRPTKSQWQRSNYPQMIQALVSDQERNELIVNCILENQGHHQLVLSKRLEHLDVIEAMLLDAGFRDPIAKITGKNKNDERKAAKELAENSPCAVLSTLADEAMDIPRLDRLHMTFPQRNAGLVTQQVGRVERNHDEKERAIIFDYADLKVGPFEKQWRIRRFDVYEPRGYKITTRKAETFGQLQIGGT